MDIINMSLAIAKKKSFIEIQGLAQAKNMRNTCVSAMNLQPISQNVQPVVPQISVKLTVLNVEYPLLHGVYSRQKLTKPLSVIVAVTLGK